MKHRTLSAAVLALAATAPGLVAQNTVIFDRVGNNNHIVWYGANLRPYQVEVSPDLVNWAEIGPIYPGFDEIRGHTDNNNAPSLFYRVREGAMRPGFDDVILNRNDDETYPYTDTAAPVDIGFSVLFYGTTYTQCYVNNNGNISFGQKLFEYTPENLGTQHARLIAPFWADVDTRHLESGVTRFSNQPRLVDGHQAFGVTWRGVGYFEKHMDKNNSFQMLLIDRSSDFNAGDFDVEFNYNQIQWETGDASTGSEGFGGDPARVGLADGTGGYLEYSGSGETLAFLDRKPGATAQNYAQGLIYQMLNSAVPGRLLIPVRNGLPVLPEGYFQVDAGSNLALDFNAGSEFSLNGSVAPDDITGVTYLWEQDFSTAAPEAQIVSPHSLSTVVNIPEPGKVYVFMLTGTKQGTFSVLHTDTVTVTHPSSFVVEGGGEYDIGPGPPMFVNLSLAKAKFNNQDITNVQWTKVSGGEASIVNPNSIHPTVSLSEPGTYEFEITATTNTTPPFVKKAIAIVTLSES